MLLDDAALRQLRQDLSQRNWAELAWAWLRQLLPRLTHCILIRAISCSSVSTATREWTSAAVCIFGGARVFVRRICKAARHASCPPSVLCFAARCECHLRPHQPHVPTYRARTSARVRSTRPSLPMQRDSQLTVSLPSGTPPASVHRGTQPSPPSCSEFRLEGLRITPLDPLVVTVRVMLQKLLQ